MGNIGITMHGAGSEVGRSCIEAVFPDGSRILLDYGLKPANIGGTKIMAWPEKITRLEKISFAAISHGHLDHVGGLAELAKDGLNCPVFCTPITKEAAELLLYDSLKIAAKKKQEPRYNESDIERVLSLMRYKEKGRRGNVHYQFFPAGHIPGSVSIILKQGRRSLLYTGDFNSMDTRLVKKCERLPHAEILIIDATYGDRSHPDRTAVEERFKSLVAETIAGGGSVMIAAFALARTQEILLLLAEMGLSCPVHLDGMGNNVTDVFLAHSEYLRDPEALRQALYSVRRISQWDRQIHLISQGVFVATSGMLEGGPIMEYIRVKGPDPKNLLILAGYQAEDTRGRDLLKTGNISVGGERVRLGCHVEKLSFSAHSDAAAIRQAIQMVKPRIVIAQHGSPQACQAVVCLARELGCEAYAPMTGDSLSL
ncbi:MAG: MBL fold metallo-hydrolase [Patescibacteria group bacterium]|nr:MBL fold metallo-hydrolase [Patescibacteria group bacterium]